MDKVKKALLLTVLLSILLTAGCGPAYDEEDFRYIENYAAEIIPAVAAALADLDAWLISSSGDKQPLAVLQEHANNIKEINHATGRKVSG